LYLDFVHLFNLALILQDVNERATLKRGTRNSESETGNRNPETGNRRLESRVHKSKKTSSSNTRKLFCIAFACKK